MSETEKLLKFYKSFYYSMWGSDYVSTDVVFDISKATANELGYSNDDINSSDVEKELKTLTEK